MQKRSARRGVQCGNEDYTEDIGGAGMKKEEHQL